MKERNHKADNVGKILDEETRYKRERRRKERRAVRSFLIIDVIAFAAGNILMALFQTHGFFFLICGAGFQTDPSG